MKVGEASLGQAASLTCHLPQVRKAYLVQIIWGRFRGKGYCSVSGLPPEGSAPLEVLCLYGMDLMFWVWSGIWSQNRLPLFWARGLLELAWGSFSLSA